MVSFTQRGDAFFILKFLGMNVNKEWHLRHIMAKNPTFEQRVRWHLEHQKHCSCRPIPEKLLAEMKKKGIKS